jgi:hypothetical protein
MARDPARFFDGDQRVAANVGGTGDACFGVVVRNHRSGRVTASQRARPRANLAHPPLRLRRAPRGTAQRPAAYPKRRLHRAHRAPAGGLHVLPFMHEVFHAAQLDARALGSAATGALLVLPVTAIEERWRRRRHTAQDA